MPSNQRAMQLESESHNISDSNESKRSTPSAKKAIQITDLPFANDGRNSFWGHGREASGEEKESDSRGRQRQVFDYNDGPITSSSTIALLSKLAKKWVKAEMELYHHSSAYVPMISDKRGADPPLQHLEAACEELERQEEQGQYTFYESPYLLVATNVTDDWQVPEAFDNRYSANFMLVPGEIKDSSTLLIKCFAGHIHGIVETQIFRAISLWIENNELFTFVFVPSNAGKVYKPDRTFGPRLPDLCNKSGDEDSNRGKIPYPRLVVEIEHTHRTGRGLREVGFAAMSNAYTRLFLAVRVWDKTKDGDFSGAAVLWGKNDDDEIEFRMAIDFGTKPLESVSKELFEELPESDDMLLPPVTNWTRPEHRTGYKSLRDELDSIDDEEARVWSKGPISSDWCMTLPAKDLLYKTSGKRSTIEMPYLLDERGVIPDCTINLKELAWTANGCLDTQ